MTDRLVKAFRIAEIQEHSIEWMTQDFGTLGAATESSWLKLEPDNREVKANGTWMDVYKPVVGGWWIVYMSGRVHYLSAEDFPKSFRHHAGDFYLTPHGAVG